MQFAAALLEGDTLADDKKYYYLKLKEDFFDSPEIKVLESQPNGFKYSNLLLKLYLMSIRNGGCLRLNNLIPYDPDMIASIARMDIDTVKSALVKFQQMGLIERLDDGTIYMLEIQNFIGKSSTEADRKRLFRAEIESQKALLSGQMSDKSPTDGGQNSDKSTPEIEIEKEIELDIDKESIAPDEPAHTQPQKETPAEYHAELEKAEKKKFHPPTVEEVIDYCNERKSQGYKNHVDAERFVDYYTANGWVQGRGKPIKDWKAAVRTWERGDSNAGAYQGRPERGNNETRAGNGSPKVPKYGTVL